MDRGEKMDGRGGMRRELDKGVEEERCKKGEEERREEFLHAHF